MAAARQTEAMVTAGNTNSAHQFGSVQINVSAWNLIPGSGFAITLLGSEEFGQKGAARATPLVVSTLVVSTLVVSTLVVVIGFAPPKTIVTGLKKYIQTTGVFLLIPKR